MMQLLRKIRFAHVGRKHTEQLTYTVQSCRQFNLLLSNNDTPLQQNQRKLASKAVNRLFVSCLFSRIIGNNFPLSIYISQTVKFHRDILFEEPLVGEIEVMKDLGKRRYEISTVCKDAQGKIIVEGIAIILQE